MPYKTFGNCVHKLNADGSKGKLIKCHDNHEKALAHMRALYANVPDAREKEIMATSKQREKRRARRQRLSQVAKAKQDEITQVEDEEEELTPEEELFGESDELEEALEEAAAKELTQKDMYGDSSMGMMPMGPTSFAEMDAMNDAREKAHEVSELSYTVQDLVWNICHAQMSPEEQAKAIKNVGDDFGKRVKEVMSAPMEKEIDMDLLQLESLIARDFRSMSVVEKARTWVDGLLDKEELTYQESKNLPDSAYALVVMRDGKKVRKYKIHDKSHVRNALGRVAEMLKRGGQIAADAKAALPAIHAAAKKFGIGVEKERGIIIEKDASGSWRWVGYPTNNFKDHSGDIITEAAHQEYVEWVNKDLTTYAPVFTSCHAPGTVRESPVDFVGYENGFVVMSGKLTEKEAAALLNATRMCDVGMSHTSWGWRDPSNPEHIVKYRAFEVTDLPVETADNPFTFLDVEISKEVDMDQLAYLTELLGSKEKAETALKTKTSMKQKELQEAQVESKEAPKEETPKVEAKQPETVNKDEIVAQVLKEIDVEGLDAFLAEAKEAMEKVPVLESLVKDMAQNRDEQFAEMLTPKASKRFMWSRSSEDTKNVIKKEDPKDQKLVENATGLGNDEWSQAFNVAPLQH